MLFQWGVLWRFSKNCDMLQMSFWCQNVRYWLQLSTLRFVFPNYAFYFNFPIVGNRPAIGQSGQLYPLVIFIIRTICRRHRPIVLPRILIRTICEAIVLLFYPEILYLLFFEIISPPQTFLKCNFDVKM